MVIKERDTETETEGETERDGLGKITTKLYPDSKKERGGVINIKRSINQERERKRERKCVYIYVCVCV